MQSTHASGSRVPPVFRKRVLGTVLLAVIVLGAWFQYGTFRMRSDRHLTEAADETLLRPLHWRECPSLRPDGVWQVVNKQAIFHEYPQAKSPYYPASYQSRVQDLQPFLHKWIYFYGDSTLRQLMSSLLNATGHYTDYNFYKFREFFRSGNCSKQYRPVSTFNGPCSMNERRCDFTSKQLDGYEITFDWKHFAYEDYDEYLLKTHFKDRKPDIFVVSFGLHDCYHGKSMEQTRLDSIKFYELLNSTFDRPVIWMDTQSWAGRHCTMLLNDLHDEIIKKFNYPRFYRFPITDAAFRVQLSADGIHITDQSVDELLYRFIPQLRCVLDPNLEIPRLLFSNYTVQDPVQADGNTKQKGVLSSRQLEKNKRDAAAKGAKRKNHARGGVAIKPVQKPLKKD